MGCSFEFDPVNNILRYCWEGPVTDEVLLEGDTVGRGLLAARPPCRGILDFSKATTVDISSQTIRTIACRPPAYGLGQVVVLVAPTDLLYGLSRMFVLLEEERRPRMSVVRTMKEAYDLLRVDVPHFSPISIP